jgi:hypothetical protein
MADINARTRLLIGTPTTWAGANLVLGDGELVLERETSGAVQMKVGNGAATYSALPFLTMTPTIPPEYVTQDEGDARYLQLSAVATTKTANLVPRMLASGLLDPSMIPLPPAIDVGGGASDAGKLVKTASTGKIDPSLVTVTTGGYLGTVDATATLPTHAYKSGDYYINTTAGLAHASWGLTAGTTVVVGQQLAYNGTAWQTVGTGAAYLPISGGTLTGNLAFSMPPSNWPATEAAIDIGIGAISGGKTDPKIPTIVFHNLMFDGTNVKYKAADLGSYYLQQGGIHQWFNAPAGAAGANATAPLAMVLDSARNLGLGVTPSAWGSSYVALELPNACGLFAFKGATSSMTLVQNSFFDGSNWLYKMAGAAGQATLSGAQFQFATAPSGAAGATIPFVPTLEVYSYGPGSANMLLGDNAPRYESAGRGVLEINGANTAIIGLKVSSQALGHLYHTGTDLHLVNLTTTGQLTLDANGATRLAISSNGNVTVSDNGVAATNLFTAGGTTISTTFTQNGDNAIDTIPVNAGLGGGLCIIRGANGSSGTAIGKVYVFYCQVSGGAVGAGLALLGSTGSTAETFTSSVVGGRLRITGVGTSTGIWHVSFIGG